MKLVSSGSYAQKVSITVAMIIIDMHMWPDHSAWMHDDDYQDDVHGLTSLKFRPVHNSLIGYQALSHTVWHWWEHYDSQRWWNWNSHPLLWKTVAIITSAVPTQITHSKMKKRKRWKLLRLEIWVKKKNFFFFVNLNKSCTGKWFSFFKVCNKPGTLTDIWYSYYTVWKFLVNFHNFWGENESFKSVCSWDDISWGPAESWTRPFVLIQHSDPGNQSWMW